MATYRRSRCLKCGASSDDVPISKRGLCYPCGADNYLDAIEQLKQGRGPIVERWRQGMANPRSPVGRPITPHSPDA